MTWIDVDQLHKIAMVEFADIVMEVFAPDLHKLRIILLDMS